MSDFTVEIPLDIAVILMQLIQSGSKRGAFRAGELTAVGRAYDALDTAIDDEIDAIESGEYDDEDAEDEEAESNVIQFPNGSKAVETGPDAADWCNCPMCQENENDAAFAAASEAKEPRTRVKVIPLPGGFPQLLEFLELTKSTGGLFGPPRLSGGE